MTCKIDVGLKMVKKCLIDRFLQIKQYKVQSHLAAKKKK